MIYMPRHARKGLNASFFHVMCQGINKEYIFEMDSFKNMYLYFNDNKNKINNYCNFEFVLYLIKQVGK